MTKTDTSSPENVLPTPSHTVGPFYGYALPFRDGEEIAPLGHPDTVTVHGYVLDGAGNPLPDALVELWGPRPDGSVPQADGSIRRDPATGAYLGRNGVEFTGWGRIQTDTNGHWYARTLHLPHSRVLPNCNHFGSDAEVGEDSVDWIPVKPIFSPESGGAGSTAFSLARAG